MIPPVPPVQSLPIPTAAGALPNPAMLVPFVRATLPFRPLLGSRGADADPKKRSPAEEREGERQTTEATAEERSARLQRAELSFDAQTHVTRISLPGGHLARDEMMEPVRFVEELKSAGVKPRRGMLLDRYY